MSVVDVDARPTFYRALPIALEYDLSVYDAVYLDAARRHGAHLATRDARVRAVASALGIETTLPVV